MGLLNQTEQTMKIHFTPSRFRLAIQAALTLFCLYVGYRFVLFLQWAAGRADTFTPKPGAVEGFLPISALMGFRQLLETGDWDPVHPAGLSIFIAVLLMVFLFRKGFCGYVCPVGFLSNLLERAGRALSLDVTPHRYVNKALAGIKYLLLGGFCFAILSMNSRSLAAFITGPYNMVADARMLRFFIAPSVLSLIVLGALAVAGLFIRNFWCRYLCPYGALLGLLSCAGPVRIRRDQASCVSCGKCTARCPSGIRVEEKKTVFSPECIGCGECIGACPVQGCLSFSVYGKKRIPWWAVSVGAVLTLLAVWAWARATGHWDSGLPPFMLKKLYATFLN